MVHNLFLVKVNSEQELVYEETLTYYKKYPQWYKNIEVEKELGPLST